MDRTVSLTKSQRTKLIALLGATIFAPILLRSNALFPWLPIWLGAAVAFVSLAAAFLVCRQAGMLRTKFLIFFVFAIGAVAVYANVFGSK